MNQEELAGRRVFLIQPNAFIRTELIPELIRQEYETCWIDAEGSARRLAKFPGCVAFLCVDSLTETQWKGVIGEIRTGTQDVQLGILTSTPDAAAFKRYQDLNLPCGVVKLSLLLKDSVAAMLQALETIDARGRRRYLRVACSDNALVNFSGTSGVIHGQIIDISTVGMACLFRPDGNWPARSALSSLQLKLRGALCLMDGFIMGSRPAVDTNERVYVVMFDPKAPPIQRDKIRAYIQKVLQTEVENELVRA